MSIFCRIDDKHIPLYRVMWVSATPHFCGEEDCVREGYYEIRLEQGEAVWAAVEERDKMLESLEAWHGEMECPKTTRTRTGSGVVTAAASDVKGASGMEMEDDAGDQLEWRDTYFILFQQSGRPTLTQVEAAIPMRPAI